MKKCTKCGNKKPHKQFSKNKNSKDGLHAWCKNCCREYNQSKKGKAAQSRYYKSKKGNAKRANYRNSESGRANNRRHAKTKKGKATSRKAMKAWTKRNPERRTAPYLVRNEIKAGRMPHPTALVCYCGASAEQYHHPDYSKPLDVVAVCKPCHASIHWGA